MPKPRFFRPTALLLAIAGLAAAEPAVLFGAGAAPPTWSLGIVGWQKAGSVKDGKIVVSAPDARGGMIVGAAVDMSAVAERTPRLHVRLGAGNQATRFTMNLSDADKTRHKFTFDLSAVPVGAWTEVLPVYAPAVGAPVDAGEPGEIAGLGDIVEVAILGDWTGAAVQLEIDRIDAVPADAAILAQREKGGKIAAEAAEQKRQADEAVAKRKADLLAGKIDHPADGARITHVGAVAADILGLEIQEGDFQPGSMVPYAAQPGDERSDGGKVWVARDGKLVEELVGQVIQRTDPATKAKTALGTLAFDGTAVFTAAKVVGTPLQALTLAEPGAYELSSVDDQAYAKPVAVVAVHRKSKPNSPPVGAAIAILHKLYLKLPSPLQEGAKYTLRLKGINTREESMAHTHDTRIVRSDAIHVSQAGFRPDDPFKRGYLSLWMGTGGGLQLAKVDTFELVDARSGKPVYSGKAAAGAVNQALHEMQRSDYAMAPTCWLDFSAFKTPGTYRLRVPGIGTSHPFVIADTAWQETFKIAMRGVLSQRGGIALGPPFLDFKRPRTSHPDDGTKFYQIDINISQGQEEARGAALVKLWKANGKLEEVTGLWGGYQDAGDWDTYTTTLLTANALTEAFEIGGDFVKKAALSLPPQEAGNRIPDLLDEALWGLAAYKRLQLPDGAVRDGFGDGWGARGCDVSWNDSNPVCVYAPSTDTSWLYAQVAARMARVLAPYDAAQAAGYATSAEKAWAWAAAQQKAGGTPSAEERKSRQWLAGHQTEAAAAAALYACTRKAAYHDRFKELCELHEDVDTTYAGHGIEPMQQSDATFIYARLPDDLADPVLKKRALSRYVLAGNVAVHTMQHNAYNIASAFPGVPMRGFCAYFTNPGMGPGIVRAHALTKDVRYLEALVASTGFGLGANPENLSFTTGVGANPIRFPLKLDSLRTGQPSPVGITVYGPSDQASGSFSEWVHTWFLTPARMVPASKSWPPPETYADINIWPDANEYCVNAPLTNAAYVWCYLAARP